MGLAITIFSKFEDVRLAVMGLIRGEQNNVGRGVLDTDTSTVVSHPQSAPGKTITLTPTSASAVTAAWYIPEATILRGSFVIQHTAGAADRTFMYEITGGG